jgi:chloramphenicol 3-O phosphotransferase
VSDANPQPRTSGRVILVNGASSAGKTTLCRALRSRIDAPFWHYSIDHFRGDVLPWDRIKRGEFPWPDLRPAFFDGFHRCLPALAAAGNNLIVEYIVETPRWMSELVMLLSRCDVFFVGVHCPPGELDRRERLRGDRRPGEAQRDYPTVHAHCIYDLEIDGTRDADDNADAVIAAWRARRAPGAFGRMLAAQQLCAQSAADVPARGHTP